MGVVAHSAKQAEAREDARFLANILEGRWLMDELMAYGQYDRLPEDDGPGDADRGAIFVGAPVSSESRPVDCAPQSLLVPQVPPVLLDPDGPVVGLIPYSQAGGHEIVAAPWFE